jgi:hypothetical protein
LVCHCTRGFTGVSPLMILILIKDLDLPFSNEFRGLEPCCSMPPGREGRTIYLKRVMSRLLSSL